MVLDYREEDEIKALVKARSELKRVKKALENSPMADKKFLDIVTELDLGIKSELDEYKRRFEAEEDEDWTNEEFMV